MSTPPPTTSSTSPPPPPPPSDAALAATMGFSAFGSQQPQRKKRKTAASGGNSTPLGDTAGKRMMVSRGAGMAVKGAMEEEGEEGKVVDTAGGKEDVTFLDRDADVGSEATDNAAARRRISCSTTTTPIPTYGSPRDDRNKGEERSEKGFAGHTWAEWRRGVRDPRTGDVAFFDWSFVEDPWVGVGGGRIGRGRVGGGE